MPWIRKYTLVGPNWFLNFYMQIIHWTSNCILHNGASHIVISAVSLFHHMPSFSLRFIVIHGDIKDFLFLVVLPAFVVFFWDGVVFCVFCLWLLIITRYQLPSKPPSSRFSSLYCETNYLYQLLIAKEQPRKPLVLDQLLLACMSASPFSFFRFSSFCISNFGVHLGLQVTERSHTSLEGRYPDLTALSSTSWTNTMQRHPK